MNGMNRSRAGQSLEMIAGACFAVGLLVYIFFYATRPIDDPDFWWHLKSGAVMVQNWELLQSDPFTFSGDGVVSVRETLILKGYWLWQLTAYGLYALFGFYGIFLLNLLTVGTMAGVVIQQLRRQQVGIALTALLLTAGFFVMRSGYPLERPQVVSLLFAAILMTLLARVREGGRLNWTLPLLMLIWSNVHGGFVVGDLILCCFAAGVVIEYRHDLPRMRHLLLWVGFGMVASLLNPNGGMAFAEVFTFHNSALMAGVSEYENTWIRFQQGSRLVVVLWLLILLYGIGIWSARRLYWPEFFVALFLAYFSVAYMRNVGFFAIAMLPAIGFYLQEGAHRRQWQLPTIVSLLVVVLCSSFLLWSSYAYWQVRRGAGPVRDSYPEKAITFLQESGLRGRMFNDYTYGGYMLWRLAPKTKIFIDGRTLEPGIFEDWQKISEASTSWVDGQREYAALLDRYAIDYVIQPIYIADGRLQPLMWGLLSRPEWVPIYLDSYVYILARLNRKNDEVIGTYRIDKNEFKTRLLSILNSICQSSPRGGSCQLARAGMLLSLGMYDEAKVQVEAITASTPNHPFLPAMQRELALLRGKR